MSGLRVQTVIWAAAPALRRAWSVELPVPCLYDPSLLIRWDCEPAVEHPRSRRGVAE
jgi:hypothetical protein